MNNENNIKEISSDLNIINRNNTNTNDSQKIVYINQDFYDSKEYPVINIENEINNTVYIKGDKLIAQKNFIYNDKNNKNSNNFDVINNLENNENFTSNKNIIINETSMLNSELYNEVNLNEKKMINNKIKKSEENCLIMNSEAMNSEKLFYQYNDEIESNYRKSSLKKKILGFFILLIIVLLIVSSSVLIKTIETNTKPFLLTYLSYNFFIIYLVIDLIKNSIIKCRQKYNSKESEDEYFEIKYNTKDESKFSHVMERMDSGVEHSYEENFAYYTIILCLLWYTTNACYNYALTLTSVTTVNSLSASNIIFVLIFEYFFLIKFSKRKKFFSFFKIFGACFSLVGIVLITIFNFKSGDNEDEKKTNTNNFFGVLFGLCSATVYASYSVYFKLQTKKYKEKFNVMQTYGFIGVFNLLIIPILLIIFHFTKIEAFSLPKSNEFFYIFINALFGGVICDFLIGYAIWLLSPDAVSFGMTMTIPLSYIFDLFIKKNFEFNLFYFFGIACIITGFTLIAIENLKKYFKKKVPENKEGS